MSSIQKVPMTVRGMELLRQELAQLKTQDRPKIIAAISEARAHGDLKENAEYHAAKDAQSFLEGRIREIESKISHAHVIDVLKIPPSDRVIFGATITLVHSETGKEVTYQLVGDDEADYKIGRLSVNAPLARAAIGKRCGDVIVVQAPAGEQEYEILTVEYR
jgi:transcription elongation factor GreA